MIVKAINKKWYKRIYRVSLLSWAHSPTWAI
jgi:hypothetical protein